MSIYVISDPVKEKENMYKVGRTSKTNKGIMTVYTRYLGNPVLKFYNTVPDLFDYKDVEWNILYDLDKYRIKNNNGNKSEWVHLELSKILAIINKCFNEMTKNII
jgi:hypothetical protein